MNKKLLAVLLTLSVAAACVSCSAINNSDASSAGETAPSGQAGSAAARSGPPDDEFGLAYQKDMPLNPYKNTGKLNLQLCTLVYEGLFREDSSFNVSPLLCASYTASENTWTINLKPGVKFHGGSVLTSSDVKYSLDLARRSPAYAERLKNISSVKADGDQTVLISLRKPDGGLGAKLCVPVIKEGEDGDIPDGTGRYTVKNKPNGEMVLSAFAGWNGGKTLPVGEIRLVPVTKADMLVYGFETWDIDAVAESKISSVAITYRGDAESHTYPTSQMIYLGVNAGRAPLSDPAVRCALSKAIGRSSLAKQEFSSLLDPTDIPINPHAQNGAINEAAVDQDFQGASALLESGKADQKINLEILCSSENRYMRDIAEAVSQSFNSIGVETHINERSFDEYKALVASRNYDIYVGRVLLSPGFSLDAFLTPGGALSTPGYNSGALKNAYDAYQAATADERTGLAQSFYNMFRREYPFIPVGFVRDILLTCPSLASGIEPSEQDLFYNLENWVR
ncbi:MAG: ABC transporter substrate-binding protein [Bacillota bacterium]|nr:ABC transporter substrate-binding protein [Bacillota bacterium]